AMPRLAATLVEPPIAAMLRKQELTVPQIFGQEANFLAQRIAERAIPAEGKDRVEAATQAFEAQMSALLSWMRSLDQGLGQAAETAAGKMQYQMDRLRRLAENFQLQRESSLTRHAQAISQAIYPEGDLQERVHGAAYYFARYGLELSETLVELAATGCNGHFALWL
ncbi:MAG TPA: bacillithiol biosynthesis BshC, partial [Terracidiphilus sp.]